MRQLIASLVVLSLAAAWASPPRERPAEPRPRVFAFLSHADGREIERLREFGSCIDIVAPNWHSLAPRGTLAPRAPDPQLSRLAVDRGFELWPVVNARTGGALTVSDRGFRRRAAAAIRTVARAGGYDGVSLDVEGLRARQRDDYTRFARRVAADLERVGIPLAIYVSRPGGGSAAYDRRALAAAADLLLVSGYNEHWSTSAPGPIATSDGFRRTVSAALAAAPGRGVPVLGAFGYRWPRGGGRGELVSSVDAQRRRRVLGLHGRTSDGSRTYRDDGDVVWYETAAGLRRRAAIAADAGAAWLGLFSAGREPRAFWRGCRGR